MTAPATGTQHQRRRALRDIVLQLALRVVNLVLVLAVTVLLVRTLGQERFGQWATILTVYQLMGSLTTLGMEGVAIREAAARPEEERTWVSALLVARLALSVPALVVGAAVMLAIHESGVMLVAALVVLAQLPLSAGLSLQVTHQLRLRNVVPMLVMAGQTVLWGGVVVVVELLDGDLLPLAVGLTATTALASAVQALLSARTTPLSLHSSREALRRLFRTGGMFGLGAMVVIAYGSIDQIIVFESAGSRDAGLYAVAYRFFTTAQFIPTAVMATVAPLLARAWPADRGGMARVVMRATELMSIPALGSLAIVLVAADPIVRLVVGDEFAPAAKAVPVLVAAFALACVGYLTTNILLVIGQTRRQFVAAFAGLVVNVAANLVLVPRYGFVAAAWVTLGTEVLVTGLCLWQIARLTHARGIPVGRVPRVVLAAGALWAALALADGVGLPLGALIALAAAVYPLLLLALRVIGTRELRMLLPLRALG
ncbi:MAG TPA: flippase [Solirubrobacteraceae bacterium]|nr:flippase [Solirubrobacteraceae bacterium]